MTKILNKVKNNWSLLLILTLGLIARLVGISHGYPYILNIDEPAIIRSTFGLRFTPFIDHFDWPHFNFYINYIVYEIFIKARAVIQIIGMKDSLNAFVPILWNDPFIFYLITRILNSTLYVLSAIPLYFVVRNFYNKKYALLSSAIYLFIPYGIFISKYAIQEPAQIFFLAWSLYFSVKLVKENNLKNAILFGLFIGLSTGIKYNAALFGIIPLAYYVFKIHDKSLKFLDLFRSLVISAVISLVSFIVTTPSLIKYWDIFWSNTPGRGFLWQVQQNSTPLSFDEYRVKIFANAVLVFNDIQVLAAVLVLIALASVIYAYLSKKSDPKTLLSLCFILLTISYFAYISKFGRATSHYFMPAYIFLPILFAGAFKFINDLLPNIKNLRVILIVLLGVFILDRTISINYKFVTKNNIPEAIKYANSFDVGTIYVKGSDLAQVKLINNLDVKTYKNDTKIEVGDIVISESELPLTQNDYKELIVFDNFDSVSPKVFLYVK
jgi:hypothetical protein